MLNTDLHNQNVKRRMTPEEFMKNLRGTDNGNDLDQTMLRNMYNRIQKVLLPHPSVHHTLSFSLSTFLPHFTSFPLLISLTFLQSTSFMNFLTAFDGYNRRRFVILLTCFKFELSVCPSCFSHN